MDKCHWRYHMPFELNIGLTVSLCIRNTNSSFISKPLWLKGHEICRKRFPIFGILSCSLFSTFSDGSGVNKIYDIIRLSYYFWWQIRSTTCYDHFVRWRSSNVLFTLMEVFAFAFQLWYTIFVTNAMFCRNISFSKDHWPRCLITWMSEHNDKHSTDDVF